jgi:hypothetical protein
MGAAHALATGCVNGWGIRKTAVYFSFRAATPASPFTISAVFARNPLQFRYKQQIR